MSMRLTMDVRSIMLYAVSTATTQCGVRYVRHKCNLRCLTGVLANGGVIMLSYRGKEDCFCGLSKIKDVLTVSSRHRISHR